MGETRDSSHNKAQRDGKKRDKCCQVCGSTDKLRGHHIIDFQFGGSSNVDNIITLCHSCHVKVHNGEIDLTIL